MKKRMVVQGHHGMTCRGKWHFAVMKWRFADGKVPFCGC